MRHVLLCSLGLSPAVVTETLWAMLQPGNPISGGGAPIMCDTVHVVTTAQPDSGWVGSLAARDALEQVAERLVPGEALPGYRLFAARRLQMAERIAALHAEHSAPMPRLVFEGVRDAGGRHLADILTAEDNVLFAEHLMRTVLSYVRQGDPGDPGSEAGPLPSGGEDDPDTVLHVSLAGGRKTMSSNAQAALTFFGRIQDRLTHVLIRPDTYERNPHFWWPGSDGIGPEAVLDLVPVPFVPLGSGLARTVKAEEINLAAVQRAGELEMADRMDGPALIVLDVPGRAVRYRNYTLALTELQTAVLALLATARGEGWSVDGYDGAGWLASLYDKDSGEFERVRELERMARAEMLRANAAPGSLRADVDAAPKLLVDAYGATDYLRATLSKLQARLRQDDLYLANRLRIEARARQNSKILVSRAWRLRAEPGEVCVVGLERKT
jgi:CRISPR-associated protein (TIGR02584 family)